MVSLLERIKANPQEFSAEGDRLPFVQPIAPPKNFKASSTYGIFMEMTEADRAGFTPDDRWEAHDHTFDSGNEVSGYLCKNPRFVILAKSSIEAYVSGPNGRRYAGPSYVGNKKVYYGEDVQEKTRYLVAFISESGEMLQSTPFQLSAGGAFGGAFSEEINAFYSSMAKALADKTGERIGQLSWEAKRYCILDLFLSGYAKEKGKFPYLVTESRLDPLMDGIVNRQNGRTVALNSVEDLEQLTVANQDSQDLIHDWSQQYKDHFTSKVLANGPQDTPQSAAPAATQEEFQGAGTFDIAKLTFTEEGKGVVPFVTTQGTFKAVFLAEKGLVDLTDLSPLAGETYNVQGLRQGGYLRVDSMMAIDEVPF